MRLLSQGLLLLTLALVGAGITALVCPQPPLLGEHEVRVIEATAQTDVLWIDARSEAEYARGHIPGAINLNEDNWSQAIADVLETWTPGQVVMVYCGSVACSASQSVAARLRGPQYQLGTVQVLHGGWDAWQMNQKGRSS